jgi:hypothetical protein
MPLMLKPPKLNEGFDLPPHWKLFTDKILPNFVKQTYSPHPSWKNKPFNLKDAHFFSKSILELSDKYRYKNIHFGTLSHAKFRSAYLLYFLPLQAAKFVNIFTKHPFAIDWITKQKDSLIIVDLGCGPATASIALLLTLLNQFKTLPQIELNLIDANPKVLQDAVNLLLLLETHIPQLKGKLTVIAHTRMWWKANKILPSQIDLLLVGNVLNEASKIVQSFWVELANQARSILFLEPADQRSSQRLSELRNNLLQSEETSLQIFGPCLHAKTCPLTSGFHWCHFSTPTERLGKFFNYFSQQLGAPRDYLKFSFFWLYSSLKNEYAMDQHQRVISDVFTAPQSKQKSILLCCPEKAKRIPAPRINMTRGDTLLNSKQ